MLYNWKHTFLKCSHQSSNTTNNCSRRRPESAPKSTLFSRIKWVSLLSVWIGFSVKLSFIWLNSWVIGDIFLVVAHLPTRWGCGLAQLSIALKWFDFSLMNSKFNGGFWKWNWPISQKCLVCVFVKGVMEDNKENIEEKKTSSRKRDDLTARQEGEAAKRFCL